MPTMPRTRMTIEEFLALPEAEPALEFVDGRICQKVSPLGRHGRLQSKFAALLNDHAEPRRLGMAFTETRTTFAGRSLVPDLCLYRWERIPRAPDGTIEDYFLTPPDLVAEVMSPGQTIRAMSERCRWYVANGVRIAVLTGADHIDLDAILPGFELTVRSLFATLRVESLMSSGSGESPSP